MYCFNVTFNNPNPVFKLSNGSTVTMSNNYSIKVYAERPYDYDKLYAAVSREVGSTVVDVLCNTQWTYL